MMHANEGSSEYRERLAKMNDKQLVREIKTLSKTYGPLTQGLAGVLEILMRNKRVRYARVRK